MKTSLALACLLTLTAPAFAGPKQSDLITTVPFELHDNRMFVSIALEGQGPFTVIFDTGGSNVITPEVAKVLGSKVLGTDNTSGAGEGTVETSTVRLGSMALGALQMHDQEFIVVDLGAIKNAFHFERLDGLIGFEVLQRARAKIDFDRKVIELFEPEPGRKRTGKLVPFQLVDQRPVIPGTIDGRASKILIDTGDRSNLTIFKRFAVSSGLDAAFRGSAPILTGVGVGGPIPGKIASIARLVLGGIAIQDVVARLPTTNSGLFATSDLSASVGIGLLQGFNLEFDYQNGLLSLEPRKGFKQESTFVAVPK
jgi:predicted aspartyl protease